MFVPLEVCVDSINSAIAAERGGASRIELCSSLTEGGLTPSLGLLMTVKKKCHIPVFVLVRPRAGDFCYNENEIEVITQDIELCKTHGADGIVIGALTKDSDIDVHTCKTLIDAAKPLPVTFHRAFDLVRNPLFALEDIISLGCKRLLTSGQASSAKDGIFMLSELVTMAKKRITIMAGGGINAENVRMIVEETGITEVHASASHMVYSEMNFSEISGVKMGASSSEKQWRECSTDNVKAILDVLKHTQ